MSCVLIHMQRGARIGEGGSGLGKGSWWVEVVLMSPHKDGQDSAGKGGRKGVPAR
jgi:hypothetical protein